MNALVQITTLQTMSSREIAELTGKEHKHVKRDCEVIFSELSLDAKGYAQNWTHPQNGQVYVEYALPKELVETLITGYSIKLRHAVIQRLHELEAQAQPFDPMKALSDPNALRGLLLGYSEKVIELEQQVQDMKPDVAALERIAKADGSLCLTDTAKALQMRPKDFIAMLNQNGWIYKRAGNSHWLGYQEKIQSGYLEHKVTEVSRGDGSTKITEQVRVTPKGLTKLSRQLQPNQLI